MRATGKSLGIAAICTCGFAAAAVAQSPIDTGPQTASALPLLSFLQSAAQPESKEASVPAQPSLPERPADETRPTRAEAGGKQGWTIEFRPRVEYTFPADLRDNDASVSIFRAGLGVGFSTPVGDRARFLLNLEAEYSNYDFKDSSTLLPSGMNPIGDALLFRIAPGLIYQLTEHWGVTGGALIEIAGEPDADVGDSATYGGYFGLRYAASETCNITFGVIAKTQLEDDVIAVPLIGLEWKIDETFTLENMGLGLRLSAKVNEHLRGQIFATYELREYRLADDGAIPGGAMTDWRVPVGVGIEWRPNPRVSITGYAGAIVYQKYEFNDSDGDRVQSDRTNPAAFIGLFASFAF